MNPAVKRHARALLALDGRALDRELLTLVLRRCLTICKRLDILLVNPPRETTSCLSMMLLRLEHSGIDYRLSSTHGDMGEEILRHLSRYRGIEVVALANPKLLSDEARLLLQLKGHGIVDLSAELQEGQ